jgi:DNA-binding SARP family transcriptional activator
VLAVLASDVGRFVPVDQLIGCVWGPDAPRRARATLHSYISRLRRTLAVAGGTVAIVYRPSGYTLVLDHEHGTVDLREFRSLHWRARSATEDAHVVRLLTDALALWRSEPLSGLAGSWADVERYRLHQERLTAEHDLADARLRSGQGGNITADLSARAARYPLDERIAGQYMLALHQAGRTADALAHYRKLRERLVDEVGIDPGAALQYLFRDILTARPVHAPGSGHPVPTRFAG